MSVGVTTALFSCLLLSGLFSSQCRGCVNAAPSRSQIPSIASSTASSEHDTFHLTPNLRIILPDGNIKVDTSSPSVMGFADVFRQDLISVTSFDTISLVSESNPSEGPIQGSREAPVILMSIDSSLDYHYFNGKSSDEGYEIHITAFAGTIRAKEPIGIWWGTRTVLQQVVAAMGSSSSNTEIRLSLGTLSDFPGWEVRGFMLDAGRHWFEASFLGMPKTVPWSEIVGLLISHLS